MSADLRKVSMSAVLPRDSLCYRRHQLGHEANDDLRVTIKLGQKDFWTLARVILGPRATDFASGLLFSVYFLWFFLLNTAIGLINCQSVYDENFLVPLLTQLKETWNRF